MPTKSTALSFLCFVFVVSGPKAEVSVRDVDLQLPVSLHLFEWHKKDNSSRGKERKWQVEAKDPSPRFFRLASQCTTNDWANTVGQGYNGALQLKTSKFVSKN